MSPFATKSDEGIAILPQNPPIQAELALSVYGSDAVIWAHVGPRPVPGGLLLLQTPPLGGFSAADRPLTFPAEAKNTVFVLDVLQ